MRSLTRAEDGDESTDGRVQRNDHEARPSPEKDRACSSRVPCPRRGSLRRRSQPDAIISSRANFPLIVANHRPSVGGLNDESRDAHTGQRRNVKEGYSVSSPPLRDEERVQSGTSFSARRLMSSVRKRARQ